MMRALIVAAAFTLSGCSLPNSDVSVPAATYVSPSPPSPQAQRKGVAAAAKEEKLAGELEISDPQTSNFGPGRWVICMRGTRDSKPIYFSVFFDNEDYKAVRLSVMSEQCERQSFRPAGPPDPVQGPGAKPPEQKQEKEKKPSRSALDGR
jgi:hypothetical protein